MRKYNIKDNETGLRKCVHCGMPIEDYTELHDECIDGYFAEELEEMAIIEPNE